MELVNMEDTIKATIETNVGTVEMSGEESALIEMVIQFREAADSYRKQGFEMLGKTANYYANSICCAINDKKVRDAYDRLERNIESDQSN